MAHKKKPYFASTEEYKKKVLAGRRPKSEKKITRKTVRKQTVRLSSKVPAEHRAALRQASEEAKKKKVLASQKKKVPAKVVSKVSAKAKVSKVAAKTKVAAKAKVSAKKPSSLAKPSRRAKMKYQFAKLRKGIKKKAPATKKSAKKKFLGKYPGFDFMQKIRRKKLGIGAKEKAGRVGAKAKVAVKTKGGTYVKYEKGSVSAKSFGAAFKKACKGDAKGFSWQGRKYSCKRA